MEWMKERDTQVGDVVMLHPEQVYGIVTGFKDWTRSSGGPLREVFVYAPGATNNGGSWLECNLALVCR